MRVHCFIDNYQRGYYLKKPICTLKEIGSVVNNYVVVVASMKYCPEIVKQLQEGGVVTVLSSTKDFLKLQKK